MNFQVFLFDTKAYVSPCVPFCPVIPFKPFVPCKFVDCKLVHVKSLALSSRINRQVKSGVRDGYWYRLTLLGQTLAAVGLVVALQYSHNKIYSTCVYKY